MEGLCRKFYAAKMGRPSLLPGIYFRALLIGYFEGDSERGIADIADAAPDRCVETHRQVFGWVLGLLADRPLLRVGLNFNLENSIA